MASKSEVPSYLKLLSPAQHQAVTYDPSIPLQILAGPGSGKTRVLTSRIAYLVQHHDIPAEQICAVTFTNKAANEMSERLKKLIGKDATAMLVMGTFHAICAKYLRIHGTKILLSPNFSICDADVCKRVMAKLIKLPRYHEAIKAVDQTLEPMVVLSHISKAKAKGQSAAEYSRITSSRHHANRSPIESVIAELYLDYAQELKSNNCLDFDDLLLFGVQLLKKFPEVVKKTKHVLVDEFQDTNTLQFELMELLASATHCISIVGDPDQSIYGWRSAEIGNLAKMRKQLPHTNQIFLEENYRSTGSILAASLAIISQDKTRIRKSLFTSHAHGPLPVLHKVENEYNEATYLADEIKRIIAYSGGTIGFGDIAILLRFNALSRPIESAFQARGIPNRILGGRKFFDRAEVKDLLAYLQVVDNPSFVPAFRRTVNTPKRKIGEKSIDELIKRAESLNISPMALAEKIVAGKRPDIKPPVKHKIKSYVDIIHRLRKSAHEGESADDVINQLLRIIDYEGELQRTQPDWETRWENVQELVTFAAQVNAAANVSGETDAERATANTGGIDFEGIKVTSADRESVGETKGKSKAKFQDIEVIDISDSESDSNALQIEMFNVDSEMTPLRRFLEAAMLSTDMQTAEEDDKTPKVTISTCHAAKGLEWPVVMVPAAEVGIFPFYRSEDDEEERRLLYVACTRAQSLLYLVHTGSRTVGGERRDRSLSPFVKSATATSATPVFTPSMPTLNSSELENILEIIDRSMPSEVNVQKLVFEYQTYLSHFAPSPDAITTSLASEDNFVAFQGSGRRLNEPSAHHSYPAVQSKRAESAPHPSRPFGDNATSSGGFISSRRLREASMSGSASTSGQTTVSEVERVPQKRPAPSSPVRASFTAKSKTYSTSTSASRFRVSQGAGTSSIAPNASSSVKNSTSTESKGVQNPYFSRSQSSERPIVQHPVAVTRGISMHAASTSLVSSSRSVIGTLPPVRTVSSAPDAKPGQKRLGMGRALRPYRPPEKKPKTS